jgi:LemA protein
MRETRAVAIRVTMLLTPLDAASSEPIGSTGVVWLIVILVLVALLLLGLVVLYNRFVQLRNRVDNAWAQIEVQLKRRWDLIPNLVETVRGYAEHERGTFEAVTEARANAQRASGPAETAAAEGILGAALGRLFAVAEAYPELQADENFRQLQDELAGTENRIAVSRQVYNDTVLTYNNAIQTFPGVVLAGPFGFSRREFFETDDTQREAPQVDFSPDAGAPAATPPAAPSAPPADPGPGGAPGGTT